MKKSTVWTLSFLAMLTVLQFFSLPNYAQVGSSCAEAFLINQIPFSGTGATNCNNNNTFDSAALSACTGAEFGIEDYMDGNDFIIRFTTINAGCYTIQLYNLSANPEGAGIFLYENCPTDGGTCVAVNGSIVPFIKADLQANTEYYLVVSSPTTAPCTSFDFFINCPDEAPVNDICSGALPLSDTGTNNDATACDEPDEWAPNNLANPNSGEPCDGTSGWTTNHNGVWYVFNNAVEQDVTLNINNIVCTGSIGQSTLQFGVWSNTGTCDLSQETFYGCLVTTDNATFVLPNLPAGDFYLFVDGTAGSLCSWEFESEEVLCTPPNLESPNSNTTTLCVGESITLSANITEGSTPVSLELLENGVTVSVSNDPNVDELSFEISPTEDVSYQIIATNTCGISQKTFDIVMSTAGLNPPDVISTLDFCIGEPLSDIGAIPVSGGELTWYDSDPAIGSPTAIFTGENLTLSDFLDNTTLGTTNFWVVEGSGNCVSEAARITINITDGIESLLDYGQSVFCVDETNPVPNVSIESGTFSADNGLSINATTGEVDLSSAIPSQIYTITYELSGSCFQTATTTLQVESVNINPISSINIQEGMSVVFEVTATASSGETVGLVLSPNNLTPDITTTYEVIATTANGCSASTPAIAFVEEVPKNLIQFPKAFSPNEDGINDEFTAIISQQNTIRTGNLEIFNRWGKKIYETQDFTQGWNGLQSDGLQEATLGIYIYVLTLVFEDDTEELYNGTFTLIR